MQGLTIDQLKLAREIGAVFCLRDHRTCSDGYLGKPGYVWRANKWKEWEEDGAIRDIISSGDDRFTIDFSPLDEFLKIEMKEREQEEWPDENNPRQQAIGQNGNDGEVYKEPERITGGYRDVGKSESVGMKDKYPKYYKDVSGLNEIDVYQIHNLFDVQDASGCLQHASKKLLLSGVRTGGKSKHDDIREARDTLTRWLDINSGQ